MAKNPKPSVQQQISGLQSRLQEAEDTLEAIRIGSVDAIVVKGATNQQIYTLESADYMYRMLIESMNQGALTLNFDGVILYSNKQFSSMLKLPLEKIIGANIISFVAPEDKKLVRSLTQEGAEKADIKVEVRLVGAQSTKLTVIAAATTVSYGSIKPYLCVVITDMTERKQAEDAKDEFISLASHQLRTPATSVKQYINMVIDGLFGELNEAQVQALQKADLSNERELKVIDDLLHVAQIDAGKVILNRTRLDLRPLLDNVLAEQTVQLKRRNQKIIYETPKKPVIANVDGSLMRMVVENLLDNASKYMLERKTVTIHAHTEDGQAILTVADEGVGMSQEDIAKLFQKFIRLPNRLSVKVGGNGLGLYWVKKVMDLHNAKIVVSSVIDKGTIFTLILPQGEEIESDSDS